MLLFRLVRTPRLPPGLVYQSARTLWSASTASDTTLFMTLRSCLSNLHPAVLTSPDVCVVLASRTFPAEELEQLPVHIASLLDRPRCTIGCVVDRVPVVDPGGVGHGVSVLVGKFAERRVRGFVVEDEKGRGGMKGKSVGRWGNVEDFRGMRPVEKGKTERENGLDDFKSVSKALNLMELPKGLAKEEGGKHQRSWNATQQSYILIENCPSLIFLVSDKEPYQLLETLDHHFSQSVKLGLIATSTPFITGRPYTLFHNARVLSGGVVGFAVTEEEEPNAGAWSEEEGLGIVTGVGEVEIRHPGLESELVTRLGDYTKVIAGNNQTSSLSRPIPPSLRSRGNIILELDDTRATQLLFDLVNKVPSASTSKDKEFYLAVAPSGTEGIEETAMVVNRITSGDPIKGNMAVDTVRDLVPGQYVQVMVEHKGKEKLNVLDFDFLVMSLYLFCRFAKQFMHRIDYVPKADSTPLAGTHDPPHAHIPPPLPLRLRSRRHAR
ncbi:hypothetical protein BC937DRAFT_90187 [Endogone sp. FLAS-F59071]|nr:hypothetical protein BC937DRAFT_90187 [Endogone sp. FLAS-F59071]|eukprot:RUS23240.1 hypothetical protein BC937DRAFT_90187 [Endogone sp. FLAS-F59071]